MSFFFQICENNLLQMPEGPSIVILKEAVAEFSGRRIIAVSGNSKIDQTRIDDLTVRSFRSWGKHFLICFDDFSLRVHLLLFGTYRINERKETVPRLHLEFDNGEINLYGCSIKFLEGDIDSHYDWSADVMNDEWNPDAAKVKLQEHPDKLICDILLDQDIFAGVGNIIKNEILYRVGVHPESHTGQIPDEQTNALIYETRNYSFQFLDWKQKFELKKHWLAHTKKVCKRCDLPLIKKQTGTKRRRSFFCENCQIQYV